MTAPRPGPLQGVRILDHFGMWAGPLAASLLAALGAEVIKVESIQRYDAIRLLRICQPGPDAHEWSAAYNGNNHGKLDVTLDLKHPRGKQLFLDLVKVSDVVTESYRPDAAAKLGITYDDLVQVRPDLIYISLNGYGSTGPWAGRAGYGATFGQIAGAAYMNGYGGGMPPIGDAVTSYSDLLNAGVAAFSIITALRHRDLTGEGQFIEQAQIEVAALLALEPILDSLLTGSFEEPTGNVRPGPENVYPCLPGEEQEVMPALAISVEGQSFRRVALDEWIAITVRSEDDWARLCAVAGDAAFARDPRFATAALRVRHREALDAAISEWTRTQAALDLAERLQAAGVPASAVVNQLQALASEHFHDRGEITLMERDYTGTHLYPGFPFHFERPIAGWDPPSPTLGQHNRVVLQGILGLSDDELDQLAADEVIGDRPVWRPVT